MSRFTHASIAALLAGCAAAGCHLIGGVDDLTFTGDGQSCFDPTDCPLPTDPCTVRICQDQRCISQPVQAGSAAADWAQTIGDCTEVACTGQGEAVDQEDIDDLPVDGDPCTEDLCTGPTPSNPPAPQGTPCGNGLECDGSGDCVPT